MDPVPETARTRELLARYRSGEREAEFALFERQRADLVERARAHRLMPALAGIGSPEDFVDECFLRALASRGLARFEDRGAGSLGGWLGAILEHVLQDAARRAGAEKRGRGVRPERLDATGAPTAAAPVGPGIATPTAPTSAARARELFELCAGVLDPDELELWRALELEGRTSAELAPRYGTTAAALRSRLRRIRARLVQALALPPEPA